MTSSINPNNIDGTFPIAGQDNDSQGFRNNFTNIKNNLKAAQSEINDLQSKVVLKSALTGTSLDNNFSGSVMYGAEIKAFSETRVDLGSASGNITLNHANGHCYTVISSGSLSIDFSNFPSAGKKGRVSLEITVSRVSHTLTLPASVYNTKGISGINSSSVITFSETGTFIFDFTSEDGGTTVHVEDKSRPRTYFHASKIKLTPITPPAIGVTGDVAGMIAIDGSYVYVCTGTYDGTTSIWKRSTLSSY